MLSIKTISESASAQRLADQVQAEHTKFFEEQEDFAIKALRQRGLYLTRGEAPEILEDSISIEATDQEGGTLWLQMKRDDEVRGAEGTCIGCGLTIGSSTKAPCYMGCRNTSQRLYLSEGKLIVLKMLLDGSIWTLSKKPKGAFLCYSNPEGPPEKLKAPSPKVIGILKRSVQNGRIVFQEYSSCEGDDG